jgi:hypothetical protein
MRRLLAEHAYQHTRSDLRSRRSEVRAMLRHHGLALNEAVIDDRRRSLVPRRLAAARPAPSPAAQSLRRLDELLNDLEHTLQAAGVSVKGGTRRGRPKAALPSS